MKKILSIVIIFSSFYSCTIRKFYPVAAINGIYDGSITYEALTKENFIKVYGNTDIKIKQYNFITFTSYGIKDTLILSNTIPLRYISANVKKGQIFLISNILGINKKEETIKLNPVFLKLSHKLSDTLTDKVRIKYKANIANNYVVQI